jgi:hypothetical protein
MALGGCSREADAPAPKPPPAATAAPVVAAPIATPTRGPVATPSPALTQEPVAGIPGTEPEDFEWDLADEADGDEFEIDADATAYYMPAPNIVTFKAKAFNGKPPITFTWNFADGSPPMTGELVQHTFTDVGRRDVWVEGKDATGATSHVQLGLLVTTVDDFVERMQRDPKKFENWKPYATPTPTR